MSNEKFSNRGVNLENTLNVILASGGEGSKIRKKLRKKVKRHKINKND